MPDNKNPNKDAIKAYKDSIRQAESGGNDSAKSSSSSATGRYQFTEATWKEMEKKLGRKLDIFKATDQEDAMNKLTEINVNALNKNNIPVTPANLYMTHFLGATGGPKFLKNLQDNPNELASKYVNQSAVKSNTNLFFKDNQPVTAAELYNTMSNKVGDSNQIQQTQQIQLDVYRQTPSFNETQIDNTSINQPRIDPSLTRRNQVQPKQVTDNEDINLNPIENKRNQLGLSANLDFLPSDINLAFSEEEQLSEELEDPDKMINIARDGGEQNPPKKKLTVSDKNDSRYKAYQDSLTLYDDSVKANKIIKSSNMKTAEQWEKETPDSKETINAYNRLTKLNKKTPKPVSITQRILPFEDTQFKNMKIPSKVLNYKKPEQEVVIGKSSNKKSPKPLIVNSKTNPRYIAYNDSLAESKRKIDYYKDNKISDGIDQLVTSTDYGKPKQEVIFKPAETKISNLKAKGINIDNKLENPISNININPNAEIPKSYTLSEDNIRLNNAKGYGDNRNKIVDSNTAERAIDYTKAYNDDIEKRYNNSKSKSNKKAQERYKTLRNNLTITPNKFEYGGATNNTLSSGLLNEFNEGKSHEENKYGGIPQGIGENGKLNTVEEGETKFNNYVFSDTLKINDNDIENLFLPKDLKGMTFSEASKYINAVLKDNPNDNIIKKTVNKQLDSLTLGNEKARLAKKELDLNLNPSSLLEDSNLEEPNQMFLGGLEDENMGNISEIPGLQSGINSLTNLAQGNKNEALNSGIKTGTTVAGTLLGGPLGGMIGGAVGDLAGGFINKRRMRKEELENRKDDSYILASQFNNDFKVGGDLNDPKYIPTLEDNLPYDSFNFNNINTENNLNPIQGPANQNWYDNNQPFMSSNRENPLSLSDNDLNYSNNNYSNPQTGIYNTDARMGTTSQTKDEDNNSSTRGKSLLQYAPVLGDFLNYNDTRNERPEVERLNRLDSRFEKNYIDESYLQNIVSNDFDNTVNSLTNASNGSSASLRSNILGANSNRTRAMSDAYFKANDVNRQQDTQAQQFDLGIDQFNISQDNQEKDINARNKAALDDRKRASRDAIFRDLGSIGREQTYDNRLYNLTGGYDSQGNYDPNNESYFDRLLALTANKDTNENKQGGTLSKLFELSNSKNNKIDDEFNKRYK